jgi:hypothetical protein
MVTKVSATKHIPFGVELRLVSRHFKLERDERTSTDKHAQRLTVTTNLSCGFYPNYNLAIASACSKYYQFDSYHDDL